VVATATTPPTPPFRALALSVYLPHVTTVLLLPDDDEGKPLFMKAKYVDSIAKAEQKMNDLRESKR
jgi:hypothetical protein